MPTQRRLRNLARKSSKTGPAKKPVPKTPEPEPILPPAAESRRESRLRRIAAKLLAGATVAEISRAEGISRGTASAVANSDECRQLLVQWVNEEEDELRALYYRSLRVIEAGLSACKEYCSKEGAIFKGGPDYYARLAATKHYREFLKHGRPAPKHPEKDDSRKRLTLPELEALLKEQKTK